MKLIVESDPVDGTDDGKGSSYEADLDEAFLLLEKLLDTNGHLHFKSESFCLDFQDLSDTTFEVEIYDVRDGFWAISEIGILAARKITEMVADNQKFGENIPTTDQMWGAYGGGEFSGPQGREVPPPRPDAAACRVLAHARRATDSAEVRGGAAGGHARLEGSGRRAVVPGQLTHTGMCSLVECFTSSITA